MTLALIIVVVLLAYAWIGYPLILAAAGRGKREPEIPGRKAEVRPVAILLSAYNEEKVIRARVENLLETAHALAPGVVPIFVGIDGASDRTAAVAREAAAGDASVRVIEFAERRGKTAVVKDLVRAAGREKRSEVRDQRSEGSGKRTESGEDDSGGTPTRNDEQGIRILVLTDANTMFAPGALERLLAPFDDPAVGGTCGRLVFTERHKGTEAQRDKGTAEGAYWDWETSLKTRESRVDSCLGANGALYAVRAGLFPLEIPDNTVVDDFVVGMKIREQGYRMVYVAEAVAEEEFPETADEWRRRVRIGAGDFQALWLCRACLSPRFGRFAWMFWSHKVLRWFTPHLLLLALAISLWLVTREEGVAGRVSAGVVLGGVAVLGLCAAVGRLGGGGLFRLCDHFATMQAALFAGSLRFLRGGLKGEWERTGRGEKAEG